MPLAFNWQSMAFSVPALISYMVPLHLAYTAQVIITLFIAGSGMYVLGRVLRLGVIGAMFAAAVFELSGPMVAWLGSPHAGVMSWAGWVFAAAILLVRGCHRVRDSVFFAVALACMLYAGQPEIAFLVGMALAVFMLAYLTLRTQWFHESVLRPARDLLVASVAGGALAAPLVLPGLQLASRSNRNASFHQDALSPSYVVHLVTQGFNGLPVAGHAFFGDLFYVETAAYVGIMSLALAVMAVAVSRRQPAVLGFAALVLVTAAVVWVEPFRALLAGLPAVGRIGWQRSLLPLTFALAVLAGTGADRLVRAPDQPAVRRWALGSFTVAALALVAVWFGGRGNLPSSLAAIRAKSFIWPAVDIAVGLAAIAACIVVGRRQRGREPAASARAWRRVGLWAGVALLTCETVFLIVAGVPLRTGSSHFFTRTPAEAVVIRKIGSSLLGYGAPSCFLPPGLGIPQNTNIVYGVRELAVYDPIIPRGYFASPDVGYPAWHIFCPGVTTTKLARRYGVTFVLEPDPYPGPQGSIDAGRVGDEHLYQIPGTGLATLTPLGPRGAYPALDAPGVPVAVSYPDPTKWRIETHATTPASLRLRLTNVPGWSATIDGRPLPLNRFDDVMLQARVPPGRHVIRLRYWPRLFTLGLVLAVGSVVGFSSVAIVALVRRSRRASAASATS
jgi:hypothetical protein